MEGVRGLRENKREKWEMKHEKEEMGGPSKGFSEIHLDAESRAEEEFLLQQTQLCEELRDAQEGGIKWLSNPTWDIELLISRNGQLYEVVQNPLWEERSLIAMGLGEGEGMPLSFPFGSLERNRSDIENFDPNRNWKNLDMLTVAGDHEIHEITRNPLWENETTLINPSEDGIGLGEEFMPFDEVAEDGFCQYLGNGEFYVSSECWNSIVDDLKNRDVQEIEDLLDYEDGKYSYLFDEDGYLPDYAGLGLNDGHYDDNFQKEFSPEMFDPGLKGMMLHMYRGYTNCLQSLVKSIVNCILVNNRHQDHMKT